MDELFDSVNGASTFDKKNKSKDLRRAVTSKSRHHIFWDTAIKKLHDIKFVTKDKKTKSVPSIKNWVVTLKSFKRVWCNMNKNKNVKIMRPRYFNSDPIENFFGQVRAYNYRSNNPSANAFKNTFKSLLITRFINFHSESYNCEDDTGKELLSVKSLFKTMTVDNNSPNNNTSTIESTANQTEIISNVESIQVQARRERLSIHSKAYTSGWVIRNILKKINCQHCKQNLITSDGSTVHSWIRAREFSGVNKRKLSYPTECSLRHFNITLKLTNEFLENKAHTYNISDKIKRKVLSEESFDFLNCTLHREAVLEYFLSITIKLCIYNWCNVINNILKGVDIVRLERSSLPNMQNKALAKYKKKLKNKKINK